MAQKRQGVSMNELMQALEVSRRTVYRELSVLEETLRQNDVCLLKDGKLYQLSGEEEALGKLFDQVEHPLRIEWSDVEKRQSAILATLILKPNTPYTQTQLADIFEVSLTTIQQDVNQLNQNISNYKLFIERSENAKLSLVGNEVYIRLYLSQLLANEINEFDFFKTIERENNQMIETESQYLLSLIDPSILQMVYRAFDVKQPEMLAKIADDILMNFVLLVTISLIRLENDKEIHTVYSIDYNQLFPYMQQILSIVKTFRDNYKTKLNTTELSFFAMQLRGINVQNNHSIFQNQYDMELAFNIKYLIKLVSQEFQFNFNMDQVLYHDLINHIGAALKRLDLKLPEMEDEVIAKLRQKYPKLYSIVEEKLIEVFLPAIFSEQEIGYVVTHFASSFEKYGYQSDLKVLVVCASGVGTSKILKTRLERSISEIERIDVVRAIDLNEIDIAQYEVILSTIMLSGFDSDYILINPILDDQEIETIKQHLKKASKKVGKIPSKQAVDPIKRISFTKVKQFVSLADRLITNFELLRLETDFQTLENYIQETFKKYHSLINKINQRLELSPLAIPDTGILLLHTTDDSLKEPELHLHDLQFSIPTIGMDQQPTEVNRILIMLGPEKMDHLTTEYLGTISSSVIEDEEYTEIYQKGNAEEIKHLLEVLSIDVLENLLKKRGV